MHTEEIEILKREFLKIGTLKISDFDKRLLISSKLTSLLLLLGYDPPIIVGGTAVAIYSAGQYATVDIDFISNSEIKAGELLIELGYVKRGKDYYHKDLDSLIEFPSRNNLENPDRVVKYSLGSLGDFVYLIGIEDLILDRVSSFYATKDLSSKEWALRLLMSFYGSLDWSYLHKISHARGFFKQLEKLQKTARYLLKHSEDFDD